jgi:cytochrome c-type biogenesis protein
MTHAWPLPAAAFLAGLVSFLSPCVLPLVPGYISIVSGASLTAAATTGAVARRPIVTSAIVFIAGFSLVFISLGAIASGVGQLISQHLTSFSRLSGALIVGFGLHLIGLVRLTWLLRDSRPHHLGGGASVASVFIMGLAFGFGWTPCAGPILGAVLTLAASHDTLGQGAVLLGVYALGLAVPFLLTALAIDRFLAFYGRFRHYLRGLQIASGAVLIAVGMLVMLRQFALINAWMNQMPFFRALAERLL